MKRTRDGPAPQVTLRLRPKNRVKWGEDVVDNEGMGKRKSNKCCIFHKRKKFGESSSESEYSSGAESGSDSPRRRGSERAQPRRQQKCSCDPSDAGEAGQTTAAARRAPFSRRVQDTEAGSAGADEPSLFAISSPLVLTPLSLSSENCVVAAAGDADLSGPIAYRSEDQRVDAARAGAQFAQAENIHPSA